MHKIIVVTPVYNGEKYIEECIRSVSCALTYGKFAIEHILVDDCSTDRSVDLIEKLASASIRLLKLPNNVGSSEARNVAINRSRGDYLFCLDQDDVLFQNSLHTLFEFATEQKAVWVYGDFLRTNARLGYLCGHDYYGHQFENPAKLLTSIFLGEHFFQQNSLFQKKIIDTLGGFDKTLAVYQDLDLCIRLALHGACPLYIPAPLYLHRFHDTNVSKQSGREENPQAHREDLKTLFGVYKSSLQNILDDQQLQRVVNYLQVS